MRGALLPPESASTSNSCSVGVAFKPVVLPPSDQVICREVGGVVGGSQHHEAAVGAQVVDAVGDGDAVGLGAGVVVR